MDQLYIIQTAAIPILTAIVRRVNQNILIRAPFYTLLLAPPVAKDPHFIMGFTVNFVRLVNTLRVLEMVAARSALEDCMPRELEVTTAPLVCLVLEVITLTAPEIAPVHFARRANTLRALEIVIARFALLIPIKINLGKTLAFHVSIVHRY